MGPEKASSVSKAEHRRTSKPLMEKKRRARINNCLSELKSLILEATKRETARHSKLEKADILEMTVTHVRNLHRQFNAVTLSTDPAMLNKYQCGYKDCLKEVSKYMNTVNGMSSDMKEKLENHLTECAESLSTIPNCSKSNNNYENPAVHFQVAALPGSPGKSNVNGTVANISRNTVKILPAARQAQTVTKVISFLPQTSDLTLVLPSSNLASASIPVIPLFTATTPVISSSQTSPSSHFSLSPSTSSSLYSSCAAPVASSSAIPIAPEPAVRSMCLESGDSYATTKPDRSKTTDTVTVCHREDDDPTEKVKVGRPEKEQEEANEYDNQHLESESDATVWRPW